ncbi:MAG TPA: hypothetical protein VMU68_11210 [Acidimicrobiales bacterium]|nr:hypothetical protein [Acidimicrobiales bacterium]
MEIRHGIGGVDVTKFLQVAIDSHNQKRHPATHGSSWTYFTVIARTFPMYFDEDVTEGSTEPENAQVGNSQIVLSVRT